MWTPDVYQGAPTPVTAFMGSATKAAAFAALLRIFVGTFPLYGVDWRPAVWGLAVLSLVVGTVAAIVQTNVKRMLAYIDRHPCRLRPDRVQRPRTGEEPAPQCS